MLWLTNYHRQLHRPDLDHRRLLVLLVPTRAVAQQPRDRYRTATSGSPNDPLQGRTADPAGTFTEFLAGGRLPPRSFITAGPDGAIWFIEPYANKIGRITTGGTHHRVQRPNRDANRWASRSDPIGTSGSPRKTRERSDGITRSQWNHHRVQHPDDHRPPRGLGRRPRRQRLVHRARGEKIGRITPGGASPSSTSRRPPTSRSSSQSGQTVQYRHRRAATSSAASRRRARSPSSPSRRRRRVPPGIALGSTPASGSPNPPGRDRRGPGPSGSRSTAATGRRPRAAVSRWSPRRRGRSRR